MYVSANHKADLRGDPEKLRRYEVPHPASGLIKNVSFLFCALALLFIIAAPSMAPAQSVQELESALKRCQTAWDDLNDRIRQNCPYAGADDDPC